MINGTVENIGSGEMKMRTEEDVCLQSFSQIKVRVYILSCLVKHSKPMNIYFYQRPDADEYNVNEVN